MAIPVVVMIRMRIRYLGVRGRGGCDKQERAHCAGRGGGTEVPPAPYPCATPLRHKDEDKAKIHPLVFPENLVLTPTRGTVVLNILLTLLAIS